MAAPVLVSTCLVRPPTCNCAQSQLTQLPQILLAINQTTIAQMQQALSK